jgi:hypothetical protein
MKITTNSILLFFGIIGFTIMACLPISIFAMPLIGPGQPQVDTAATLQVIVAQTMAASQSAPSPTPTLYFPVSTPVPATSTSVPPTRVPATPTAVSYCDWVLFVKDVTIPDGSPMGPGEVFTKTWRLQNRGTCTWTSDYMLVFASGDPMGGTTAVRLPGRVAPGQTVDVSVTLTAPNSNGRQVGYWMLRNPSGQVFGYGENANKAFYVDIRVRRDRLPHGEVTDTDETIQFSVDEDENFYNVLLPNGTYYAYAWAPDYNLEGAYTHSNGLMKTFVVSGGVTTPNINLCDWSPHPHARGD